MSTYKDAKLGTWYVKFRHKDWKNEFKWVTKRGFSTKREASQWEQEYLMQCAGDLGMNFEAFAKRYEADLRPRMKESTWCTKEHIIQTKIIPYFKTKRVCDISATDVVQWQNQLLRYRDAQGQAYSPTYLKTLHNQLSAILNHAVRFYNLQKNPARTVGNMGSEHGVTMQFWTKEEYQAFSEELMEKPLAYYAFELLYWCGMREGELLALQWEDFDFEHNTVSISKTYHRIGGRDVVTPPKTPKSKRTISMPDFLCEEMTEYLQMTYQRQSCDRAFPITKSYLQYQMKQGSLKAGVKKIRVHDLRHSHVSLLIHMGFSAVAIAERMGHESIDITYRYAHLFPSVQKDMASQLNVLKEVM